MNKYDVLILVLHGFAFAIWAADSKTIESWRNQRAYWRALEEHSSKDKIFDQEMEELLTEYREKMRKEAMQRHPAGSAKMMIIKQDDATLARVIKNEFDERRRYRKNHILGAGLDFWPLLGREQNKNE